MVSANRSYFYRYGQALCMYLHLPLCCATRTEVLATVRMLTSREARSPTANGLARTAPHSLPHLALRRHLSVGASSSFRLTIAHSASSRLSTRSVLLMVLSSTSPTSYHGSRNMAPTPSQDRRCNTMSC